MWSDAYIGNLAIKEIIKHTISAHHNNVVMFDLVFIVLCIVWQIAILTALIWEVEFIRLFFRPKYFLNHTLIVLTEDQIA